MITKEEASKAWNVIEDYAFSNIAKESFTKDDVTYALQNAVKTLKEYFSQEEQR